MFKYVKKKSSQKIDIFTYCSMSAVIILDRSMMNNDVKLSLHISLLISLKFMVRNSNTAAYFTLVLLH
jgi:hypothetical protein